MFLQCLIETVLAVTAGLPLADAFHCLAAAFQ